MADIKPREVMMPVGKRSLGDALYVFSTNNGLRTSTSCVISGHGSVVVLGSRRFVLPPGVNVSFYGPHGNALRTSTMRMPATAAFQYYDNAVYGIALGAIPPVETITGGNVCPNYTLSKIEKSGHGAIAGGVINLVSERGLITYDDIEGLLRASRNINSDIVTVRDRSIFSGHALNKLYGNCSLSDAVALLAAEGYTDIRCCFCRSYLMPGMGGTTGIDWHPT